jgi:hypothetical protein
VIRKKEKKESDSSTKLSIIPPQISLTVVRFYPASLIPGPPFADIQMFSDPVRKERRKEHFCRINTQHLPFPPEGH